MKKVVLYLLVLLCLSSCTTDDQCDVLRISVSESETIYQSEPDVRLRIFFASFARSHAHFKCTAWWDGAPLDERSPLGLITELCVGGKCEKGLGQTAELKIWASDWDELQNHDAAYCVVYMPYWDIQEGQAPFTTIVESHPERVILRERFPLSYQCEQLEGPDTYCLDGYYGVEGWECTEWV